ALKVEAPGEKELLGAMEQMAQAIRDGMALSPEVVAELQQQSMKPSSQSVQALRRYNEGLELARRGKAQDAVERFTDATREDPNFALAYSRLGQAYSNLGYDNDAEKASRRAVTLAAGLPAQEKYIVEAIHARISNDMEKAIGSYENLAKVSPGD